METFVISVKYDWQYTEYLLPAAPDYTLVLYSQQFNMEIKKSYQTRGNMLHMDGSAPSGFTDIFSYRRPDMTDK